MKKKDEAKALENLLTQSPDNLDNSNLSPDEIPGLKAEPVTDVDFIQLRSDCELEAEIMLRNAIAFIIPPDMLSENEYMNNKLKVDVMSLSGMIYQLRTNEIMQKALIDQINSGMINARMFEVFSSMTKIIGEINKQLIQTVEALKETYKSFKNDIKEQRTEAIGMGDSNGGLLTTSDGNMVVRGTKDLIKNVKAIKEANAFIDSDVIPEIDLSN